MINLRKAQQSWYFAWPARPSQQGKRSAAGSSVFNLRKAGGAGNPVSYCPVPLSVMVCGEPAALSVMVTAAVCAPVAVGAKCPWMVQLAPTVRLAPQVLAKTNEEASVPVSAMLVIVKVAVPVLVMVTDCDALVEPTMVAGNARLAAENVTGPDCNPVPVSAMVCGDVAALSVRVTAAVRAPVTAGAKCP